VRAAGESVERAATFARELRKAIDTA